MSTRRDVKIKSASLHKEVFLKGAYSEKMGKAGDQNMTFNCSIAVHPHLRIAFNALTQHAIALADLWESTGHRVAEDKITILGFAISGESAAEGVTISFTRELPNLKLVAIDTPFQAWNDQVAPYLGTEELSLLIEDCKAEVYEYLFNDKHQPDTQGDLFSQPDEDDSGRTRGAAAGDDLTPGEDDAEL